MRNLKDEKINDLITLGFNIKSLGFLYWQEAMEYIKNKGDLSKMSNMYSFIAKKCNSNISNVERLMRYSLKPAIPNICNYYGLPYSRMSIRLFLTLKLMEFSEEKNG